MQSLKHIKLFAVGFILVFLFTQCKKEDVLFPTKYISGKTFENGLRVEGHEFDSLIIEDCTFHNYPLNIGEADYIVIRNCLFENIDQNGVKVGFIGPAKHILIEGCTFRNIGYNAIDSHEDAPHGIIRNCYFKDVALSDIGAAMAQPHHGIYWKAKNVRIEGNTFINGLQNQGNAISVRSSGWIRNNTIKNSSKNGITYYANHPGGDSLLIENNFIVDPKYHSVVVSSAGNQSYHNQNVVMRFNSMVQTGDESIYVAADFESTTQLNIYGNVMVNPSENYFRTFYTIDSIHHNLTAPSDIGFIDRASGDLHITANSIANGYCSGLPNFPSTDIDNDPRTTTNLDVGADEIN